MTTVSETRSGSSGVELVAEGVWSVALSLPDKHLSHVLSYLIRDGSGAVHVIDPGWTSDENRTRLSAALSFLGSSREAVASVILTHLHSDHLGLADDLVKHSGAPIRMLRNEQLALDSMHDELRDDPTHRGLFDRVERWGAPQDLLEELVEGALINYPEEQLPAAAVVDAGEVLAFDGIDLTVMATPGHTFGSMCLRDDERRLIITGDHVLPNLHPGLGLGGMNATTALSDYLDSLDALADFGDYHVLPGHGAPFDGLADRVAGIRAHHLRRSAEIDVIRRTRPGADVWTVASEVGWSAGWERLRGPYLYSALNQTAMHVSHLERADAAEEREVLR